MGSTEKLLHKAITNIMGSPLITGRSRSRCASKTAEDPAYQTARRAGESRVLLFQKLHPIIEGSQTRFNTWKRKCLNDECFSTRLYGCFYQCDWMEIKIYKLEYVFLFLIPSTTVGTIHTGKLCHDATESRRQFPEVHRGRRPTKERGIKTQARIKTRKRTRSNA